jgi:hypothetical protein
MQGKKRVFSIGICRWFLYRFSVSFFLLLSLFVYSVLSSVLSLFAGRGVSYTFGHDIIADFLNRHGLDLICRAHQVVEDGYEFQANRQLCTIFSAPNYCGEFDNAGAIMVVNTDLVCSFKILRPISHKAKIEAEEKTA